MDKEAIRLEYRQKRRDIPLSERILKSKAIQKRFFSDPRILTYLYRPASVVHTYLPIARQHEVDTWPLIRQMWRDFPQVRTWSSITEPETHTMRHFQLTAETALIETKWGILTPSGTYELADGLPGLVIVPLLAFDRQGNRVGYGGGYYDRFLANVSADCLKIGLSFFEPVAQIDTVEETDVRLNGCISPDNTYLFT